MILISNIIKNYKNKALLFINDDIGAAFVEFAVILPTLALLLVGVINYGAAWYHLKKMNELLEAIVLYVETPNGIGSLSNTQMIESGTTIDGASITAAVIAANPDLSSVGTPAYTVKCGCPSAGNLSLSNPAAQPPPFCPMPSPTTQTCTGGLYWGTYLTVTITNKFTSLFPAYFQDQNMSTTATIKIY